MTLEILDAHRSLVVQLDAAESNLRSLEASILHAASNDGMPGGDSSGRKTEALAVKLNEQREIVQSYKRAVKNSEKTVLPYIDAISDNSIHLIFYYRFIIGLEWKDVAATIGGKNTENAVKAQCYRYLQA